MADNRVRKLRTQKGITQEELAHLARVGRSTISNVETGKYIPRVDVAIQIARALGQNTEDVFIVEKWEET